MIQQYYRKLTTTNYIKKKLKLLVSIQRHDFVEGKEITTQIIKEFHDDNRNMRGKKWTLWNKRRKESTKAEKKKPKENFHIWLRISQIMNF